MNQLDRKARLMFRDVQLRDTFKKENYRDFAVYKRKSFLYYTQ